MPHTLLIVPCYNEEKRLPVQHYKEFAPAHPEVRFLFVNDGSKDETLRVLNELRASNPEAFDVLDLPKNGGKAEAVRQGFLEGLRRDDYPYIGFWDSDLATPLDVIPMFEHVFATHPHVQAIMGARVQLLGRKIHRSPRRHYMGRLAATLISFVLQIRVYDTQCGAKMYRVGPYLHKLFDEPFLSKWLFDVELLVRFIQTQGTTIEAMQALYEFPLLAWRDVGGSKVKSMDFLKALYDLARIVRSYDLEKSHRHPHAHRGESKTE